METASLGEPIFCLRISYSAVVDKFGPKSVLSHVAEAPTFSQQLGDVFAETGIFSSEVYSTPHRVQPSGLALGAFQDGLRIESHGGSGPNSSAPRDLAPAHAAISEILDLRRWDRNAWSTRPPLRAARRARTLSCLLLHFCSIFGALGQVVENRMSLIVTDGRRGRISCLSSKDSRLPKLDVAGSSPVSRSIVSITYKPSSNHLFQISSIRATWARVHPPGG
jgi:hypothetical protein